jgi:hypothetical protein
VRAQPAVVGAHGPAAAGDLWFAIPGVQGWLLGLNFGWAQD